MVVRAICTARRGSGVFPDWPELADLQECVECEVPPSARPSDRVMEPA